MLIRKLITAFKFIELSFKHIKIKKTLHSNISASVKAYNKGKKINIGNVYIRSNVSINTDGEGVLDIGDNVFINRNSIISCRKKIRIGDRCIIGPNVCIYDHDHKLENIGLESSYTLGEVIIENNCWIGAGAIILKGTHIANNCVIAAGSVIKGNYPANSIIYNKRETVIKPIVNKEGEEKAKDG